MRRFDVTFIRDGAMVGGNHATGKGLNRMTLKTYGRTLAHLVGQIESGNWYGAIRFEPHVYFACLNGKYQNSFAKARSVNRCSKETACAIVATSWGRFQIMGFNVYDYLGLNMPVATFLGDREAQEDAFWNFVMRRKIDYSLDDLCVEAKRLRFARTYNGSLTYADKISKTLIDFGFDPYNEGVEINGA